MGLGTLGQLGQHSVHVAGVGVDDVPFTEGGAQLAPEGRQLVLLLGLLGLAALGRLGVLRGVGLVARGVLGLGVRCGVGRGVIGAARVLALGLVCRLLEVGLDRKSVV